MKYLLALFTISTLANAQVSTYRFEPIMVEESIPTSITKPISSITPSTGIGAEKIDETLNSYGIEIDTMNQQEDISTLRRQRHWQLLPSKHSTSTQMAWGNDQLFSLKGQSSNWEWAGELYRNYHPNLYLDNNQTPYTATDDAPANFNREESRYFAGIKFKQKRWSALLEKDQLKRNSIASAQITGHEKKDRNELNLNYQTPRINATIFYLHHQDQFEARDPTLTDSNTTGDKVTSSLVFRVNRSFSSSFDFGHEQLNRRPLHRPELNFTRTHAQLKLSHLWNTSPWLETQSSLSYKLVGDKSDETQKYHLVNAGTSITSSTQYPWGAVIQLRYFEKVPTPLQRFGDGGMLEGNSELPPEKGVRASIGPWLKTRQFESHLNLFSEEAKNGPIQQGIGPAQAKTLPIGGTWARGIEWTNQLSLRQIEMNVSYQYQKALNDSDINWQRGNPIPDRPQHQLTSSLSWKLGNFLPGIKYHYSSGTYLDLAGMEQAPSYYQVHCFLSYKQKNLLLRLEANNLLMSNSLKNAYAFEDRAGENILEPAITQKEFKAIMELTI